MISKYQDGIIKHLKEKEEEEHKYKIIFKSPLMIIAHQINGT